MRSSPAISKVAQETKKVKRELIEEITILAQAIKASTDRTKQNELKYELAGKLVEIQERKIYREYGFSSFHEFAEKITGLSWRTVRYLIDAYCFVEGRKDVFIQAGYRKINALQKKYRSVDEVSAEDLRMPVRDIRTTEETPEKDRRKLSAEIIQFARRYGIEELKELLKKAIAELKEEGLV